MDVILFSVIFLETHCRYRAFLIAQLVNNRLQCKRHQFDSWVRKIHWRRVEATRSSILGLLLWLSWWRIHLQCGRPGFDSWVGKIPWRRESLPTPVFCPGEVHGLYSPQGLKESDTTEWLSLTFTFIAGISSVQFSCSVMSDSLWPHESQRARPLYPSLTPGVHSNSWPSSR